MRASRLLRRGAVLFTVCAIVGCGSDLSTGVIINDLNGSWTELDQVPGSSEHWTLATHDSVVTGTGTWSGEACCGGTLTVAGYVKGDSVHLLVIHVTDPKFSVGPRDPYASQFNGRLVSPTMLVGDRVRFKKD